VETEQKWDNLSEKHTKSKGTGGMAQVVEHLPTKGEAEFEPLVLGNKQTKKGVVVYYQFLRRSLLFSDTLEDVSISPGSPRECFWPRKYRCS
jgi:hypothetical protein